MTEIATIRYPLRVVALGGGTGLPQVLRGFKALLFPEGADDPDRLVAVVTVTDEGGSSGRLRQELGVLPPGDIRNCLVALSHNEPLMARLFQARYRSGGVLEGHNVGNLILAALAQEEGGSFLAAVRLASEVLNIQGRVYPATPAPARIAATLADGSEVLGETALARAGKAVRRLRLHPEDPPATPEVVEAIRRADLVVLGPGSLFTSIIPNVLVPEIREALQQTRACRLLYVNAMTERGETNGFSAADHVRAVLDHAGPCLDAALVPVDEIPGDVLERYREEGAERVDPADPELDGLVPLVLRRQMLRVERKVRHDPLRCAAGALVACSAHRGGSGDAGVGRIAGGNG